MAKGGNGTSRVSAREVGEEALVRITGELSAVSAANWEMSHRDRLSDHFSPLVHGCLHIIYLVTSDQVTWFGARFVLDNRC